MEMSKDSDMLAWVRLCTQQIISVVDEPIMIFNLSNMDVIYLDHRIVDFFEQKSSRSKPDILNLSWFGRYISTELTENMHELFFDIKRKYDEIAEQSRENIVITCILPIINKYVKSVYLRIRPLCIPDIPQFTIFVCSVMANSCISGCHLLLELETSKTLLRYNIQSRVWNICKHAPLSNQEIMILRLYLSGLSTDDIAEKMCKTKDTVKYHIKSINKKLGVNRFHNAVVIAVIKHLI